MLITCFRATSRGCPSVSTQLGRLGLQQRGQMQHTKRLHFSSDNTSHSIVQRSARHLSLTSMMDKSLGYHEQWHDKTEDDDGGGGGVDDDDAGADANGIISWGTACATYICRWRLRTVTSRRSCRDDKTNVTMRHTRHARAGSAAEPD
jgi:hypothetical protein